MNNLKKSLLFAMGFVAVQRILFQRHEKFDLHNHTALITGGSRGLGLLIARELGYEGCRIAICARDSEELEEAKEQLSKWGINDVLTIPCDMADQAQVGQLISTMMEHFGSIDILVNNAGVIQAGPLESQTIEDFQQSMNIMFWGDVYVTLALLPQMLERKHGHIVNVTSIGGKVAVPHLLPYASAKFAATGFSEGLAGELLGKNIHVTTVIPGLMRTGSYLNAFFKGQFEDEFRWFGLLDNMPFISIDAEHAASEIVKAVKRGDTEIILSIPAQVLARVHGLFPGLTTEILSIVNELVLPSGDDPGKRRGMVIQETMRSPIFNWLTQVGRLAARRFNQYPDEEWLEEQPAEDTTVNGQR